MLEVTLAEQKGNKKQPEDKKHETPEIKAASIISQRKRVKLKGVFSFMLRYISKKKKKNPDNRQNQKSSTDNKLQAFSRRSQKRRFISHLKTSRQSLSPFQKTPGRLEPTRTEFPITAFIKIKLLH